MLRLTRVRSGTSERTRGKSDGVTLIELVVVVAVMGIVLSGITALLLVSTDATKRAQEQLNEDGGLRVASVYFNPDVHSADAFATGSVTCGPGSAADLVVELRGKDAVVTDPRARRDTAVSYVRTDGGSSLTRYSCEGVDLKDTVVVADGLDPQVSPQVACWKRDGSSVACNSTDAASVTLITTSAVSGNVHRMTATRRTA